jgi:hypothetical protein
VKSEAQQFGQILLFKKIAQNKKIAQRAKKFPNLVTLIFIYLHFKAHCSSKKTFSNDVEALSNRVTG